ncbi:MAG: hypothetical protein ACOZIN_03845 [Myxococcota bacterium]
MGTSFPDEDYRRRLEGRAALLDTTRARYQDLVALLRSLRWRKRLRRHTGLLREVLAVQAQVDEALTAAKRRAKAEGWPARASIVRCLREVESLREKLCSTAAERLGCPQEPLVKLLWDLEAQLACGARASEVLSRELPELRDAVAFGEKLEALFGRPFDPSGKLPFAPEELAALQKAWPAGESALAAVWARLAQLDDQGALARALKKQAGHAPRSVPKNGQEQLLRAEFWHGMACARMAQLCEVRLAPLAVSAAERLEVVCWLCAVERNPSERLSASATLSEERVGALELSHTLWQLSSLT